MTDTEQKKEPNKKRTKRMIIIFAIELVILLIVLGVLAVGMKMSKLDGGNKIEKEVIQKNELTVETQETLEKYTTIAFFGLDNRSNGQFVQGNSDVIIIASINENTKEVKLVSVYRDTLLDITEDMGYRKANAAFANGGVEQAINMLNVNLDLEISEYVIVDFNAVASVVDLLGGVEVEITGQEARLMHGYQDEISKLTGKKSSYLWEAGTYNLDGVQATSYARIRYTAGDDYKRTERQRLIIEKMVEKALSSDLATINSIVDEMLDKIETSFTATEVLLLAKDAFSYSLGENTGFPFDKLATDIGGRAGDCVVPLDLANNVKQLHEFLFETEEYEVTDTVQKISDEIEEFTGLSADDIPQ